MVYLDNSATTRQYDSVTEIMTEYMKKDFGNPSSLHRLGIQAEKGIKNARKEIALALGAKSEEIVFTSGGTEADNMALLGTASARKRRGNKIITTAVEHPAVLETVKRLEGQGYYIVEYIGVDEKGNLDVKALQEAVDEATILISVMGVNNEVGTVEPLEEIIRIKNEYNKAKGTDILFHTDAVQALGKIPMSFQGVDLISVSGHKIHGPKGIGALYIRKGLTIEPYLIGGGQEKNMRSGTENVPAIVGFGHAAKQIRENFEKRILAMSEARNYLLKGIKEEIKDIKVNGVEQDTLSGESGLCSPSVLNISFLGTRGEVILHTLEQADIYVSIGSACSSNKNGQSHVLKAMGLNSKEIESAIRFSFNEFNTMEEMDYVLEHVKSAVTKFRKLGSFR
ncbi:cysteine desulfurase family protein [Clostridium aminobutyricum]|uniref:Cysteine desulfurase n=1 Tax=Clostridium aminobutyricum TaxID=33953 RepID=A0A939II70_CLOAM|nr:cysteine desulfurase family protein [Clostridium aminobutyricum]MBN7772766.1 cysteine desulfurase [Clostridium aminobutyricum]